ncbi:MAG: ABC transporter permease [Acidobacteriota bacterium]
MLRAFDTLRQDFRLAVRKLLAKPAFTAVAVLSLALGIGANTAIFSVVNTVLLQPLPYPEPSEIVRIWETYQHPGGRGRGSVSVPNLKDWQAQNRSFEAIGGYNVDNYNLMGQEAPSQVRGAGVTPEVFSLLGVPALLGRPLGADDGMHDRVVVLSHGLWQSFYGSDATLVGRTIRMDGESYAVVGVMPPTFEFPPRSTAQLWTPMIISQSAAERRGSHWVSTVARLAPGVELATARADMEAIAHRLAAEYPESQESRSVTLRPLAESVVAQQRPALLALWGAVGFVLLIACGNVANLMLARAAAQDREFAVRAALGAGRGRLAQQVLLESSLLALTGGALGLAAGWQAIRYLATMPGSSLPTGQDVVFDLRVLAFCGFAAFVAATLAGLVPALRASRTDLQASMKERSSSGSSQRDPIRAGLVVAEIALALVVLIGASLLVRSFFALQSVDPGVRTENVLTLRIPLPDRYDSLAAAQGFYDTLLPRVEAIPGVVSAGTINLVPVQDWGWNGGFLIEGRPELPPSQVPFAENRYVGGHYFASLGIPIVAGRGFDERDHAESLPVVMINQTAARSYWPDESPVGQRIGFGSDQWLTVIGIAGDVQNRGLRNPVSAELYFPNAQHGLAQMSLVARTEVEPLTVAETIRAEVRRIDPEQPVYQVKTMQQVVTTFVASSRFNGILFSLFAGLALVLAMLGIYGVMAYNVTQRTGEIGLRMALGANRSDVVRLFVVQGLRLAAIGAAFGVASAMGLTRFLESQLFAVEAMDTVTFGGVTAALVLVAVIACLIPARRAASVEPTVALHYE